WSSAEGLDGRGARRPHTRPRGSGRLRGRLGISVPTTKGDTMKTFWKRFAIAGVIITGLALGSMASAATPDAWVTTKAKLALMTTDGVSSTDVNVDTIDGHVTLHGTVGSEQEKAKAEQAVRGITGVKDVRNMLQVVPPAQQE